MPRLAYCEWLFMAKLSRSQRSQSDDDHQRQADQRMPQVVDRATQSSVADGQAIDEFGEVGIEQAIAVRAQMIAVEEQGLVLFEAAARG